VGRPDLNPEPVDQEVLVAGFDVSLNEANPFVFTEVGYENVYVDPVDESDRSFYSSFGFLDVPGDEHVLAN